MARRCRISRLLAMKEYEDWEKERNREPGMNCLVKVICDSCGNKWTEDVKQTLPPCPKCGSDNVFEYDTLSVG